MLDGIPKPLTRTFDLAYRSSPRIVEELEKTLAMYWRRDAAVRPVQTLQTQATISAAQAERQMAVIKLHATGINAPAIAAALDIEVHLVYYDLRKSGLKPNNPTGQKDPKVMKRRAIVSELRAFGYGLREIPGMIGVPYSTIKNDLTTVAGWAAATRKKLGIE
jgi:transposase